MEHAKGDIMHDATSPSDASHRSPYAYSTLAPNDDAGRPIRLLRIQCKGHSTTEPRYSIVHTTLRGPWQYEASSYVWGTSNRDAVLELDDGRELGITKPLKDALSVIVEYYKTSYLWIDQICINQDDLTERNR